MDLKKEFKEISKKVEDICFEMTEVRNGEIVPRKGITEEQMAFALKQMKEIASMIKERKEAYAKLSEKTTEQEKRVEKFRNRVIERTKEFGPSGYSPWFLKIFGL